ncbi:MAG: hypothetical protein ACLP7Q_24380 [Isosphaeraceae bacterium]
MAVHTAWLGGKLVQEYGEAVKPVIAAQAGEPSRLEDQSHQGDEPAWAGRSQERFVKKASRERK